MTAKQAEKIEPMAMQTGYGRGFKGKKCKHCRMKGHTKETCYKIVDYPPGFQSRRSYGNGNPGNSDGWKRNAGTSERWRRPPVVNNADDASSSRGFGNGSQHEKQAHFNSLSDEQYRKILSLLNKESRGEPQGNMTGPLQWQGEGDW